MQVACNIVESRPVVIVDWHMTTLLELYVLDTYTFININIEEISELECEALILHLVYNLSQFLTF